MDTTFKQLTKAEEEVMQALWKLDKAFVKDMLQEFPDPKPHYNTISTIIKILGEKGFVGYETFGKSNRYYPLVRKDDYTRKSMRQFLKGYFAGSYANMVSFFAHEKDLSIEDLENILSELKKQEPEK